MATTVQVRSKQLLPRASPSPNSNRAVGGGIVQFADNPTYYLNKPSGNYLNVVIPTVAIPQPIIHKRDVQQLLVEESGETNSLQSGSLDFSESSHSSSFSRENDSPPLIDDFSDDEEVIAKSSGSIPSHRNGESLEHTSMVDLSGNLLGPPPSPTHHHNINNMNRSYGGDIGIATDDFGTEDGDQSCRQHRMPAPTSLPPKSNKPMSRRNRLHNITSIVQFFQYFHRYSKEDLLKAFRRIQRLQDVTKVFTMNVEQQGMASRLLDLLREYSIGGYDDLLNNDNVLSDGPIIQVQRESQHLGNEVIAIELLRICCELVTLNAKNEDIQPNGRDKSGIDYHDVYHPINVVSFNSHCGLHISYRIMKNYVGTDRTGAEKDILALLLKFIAALGSIHDAQVAFGQLDGCEFIMNTVIPLHIFDPIVLAEACQVIANMSVDDTVRQQFLQLNAFRRVEEILFFQKKQSHVVECCCNAFTSLTMVPTVTAEVSNPSQHGHQHHHNHHHHHHTSSSTSKSHPHDDMDGVSIQDNSTETRTITVPAYQHHQQQQQQQQQIQRPVITVAICELLSEVLELQKNDSKAVAAICRTIGNIANSLEIVHHLARAGCCDLIVEILAIHIKCAHVIEHAVPVIQKLSIVPEYRRSFGVKPSNPPNSFCACELLYYAAKAFNANPYVLPPTYRAMKSLSLEPANQAVFGKIGTCKVLASHLSLHMSNGLRGCIEPILSAIWSMSTVDIWQKQFAKHDGFCETLITAVKEFRTDLKVAEKGCAVIKNLAQQPDLCLKFGILRACELLTEILRFYGHCPLQQSKNTNSTGGNGNGNGNGSQSSSTSHTPHPAQNRGTHTSPLTKSNLSSVANHSNNQHAKGSSDKGSQSGASNSASHQRGGLLNPDREYNPRKARHHQHSPLPPDFDSPQSTPRDQQDIAEPSTPVSSASQIPTSTGSGPGSDGGGSRRHSFTSETSDSNSLTPSQSGPQIFMYRPLSPAEMKVLEQCLWAIWNLAVNSENEKKFGRLHTCFYLLYILRNNADHPPIVEAACGAIKNLSTNKDNILKFMNLDVCELLVDVLKKYADGCSSTQSEISASTITMSYAGSGIGTQYQDGYFGLTSEFSDYGDSNTRVLSWQRQHVVILRQMCSAIGHFAVHSKDCAIRFLNADCCSILINITRLMSTIVSSSMSNPSSGHGSVQSGSNDQKSDEGQALNTNQDLLTKAMLTIADLSIIEEQVNQYGHLACFMLIEMCTTFMEKPSILEAIFKLLKVLSSFGSNQMYLGEIEGSRVMVQVLQKHIGNNVITEAAIIIIQNVSLVYVNATRFIEDGAAVILIEILRLHRARAIIVAGVIKALYNLSNTDANRATLYKLKVAELAKAMKAAHPNDATIVKDCNALIEKIRGKRFFGIF